MATTQPATPALTPEQSQKQAQILQDGSGFEAYQFASEVPGADIPALQARVLAVGDSWDLFHYARDVRGADWASLQAQLLRGNSIRFIACFAREIPGADLATCQARVLEAGDSIDVLQFAQIPGVDVGQLQARMLKVGSPLHAYWFAFNVPESDVLALYAYAQAQNFKGMDSLERNHFAKLRDAHLLRTEAVQDDDAGADSPTPA